MKLKTILFIILSAFLLSCDLFNSGNDVPDWYPSTWTFSQSEMDDYNNIYSDFLEHYNVSEVLYAHHDTLCSHLFSYCSRDIVLLCSNETEDERISEFETNFHSFFLNWWRLFSAKQLDIDYFTTTISQSTGKLSADVYLVNSYKYPLESRKFDLGRLQIGVDETGYLETLWSTVIPQLPVPSTPRVTLNEAKEILIGYTYTINAWLYNKEITLEHDDLNSSMLITFIENNSQNRYGYIKYRLAWKFEVEDANVYVDAITGEILGIKQTTIYM